MWQEKESTKNWRSKRKDTVNRVYCNKKLIYVLSKKEIL